MRVGARTDRGLVREANEDSYCVQGDLFAVADGLGGHNAGEVASRIAVDVLCAYEYEGPSISDVLREAISHASRRIHEEAGKRASAAGMGTTIAALVLEGETGWVAGVGDSRVYRVRDGEIEQLTEDHSLTEELVRQGEITREQARQHPQRNVLTQALGTDSEVRPDLVCVEIQEGDLFLLCTDGLTSVVSDEEMRAFVMGSGSPEHVVDSLIEAANQRGGHDNITVIVVEV